MSRYVVGSIVLFIWFYNGISCVKAGLPEDLAKLKSQPTREAWDRVVALGPKALLPILNAWPDENPVVGHWLRSAFDRIVQDHPAKLPQSELRGFLDDTTKPGSARRLALFALERAEPGTRAKLLEQDQTFRDPEFSYDAIQNLMLEAEQATDEIATKLLAKAFQASTTVATAFELAKRLKSFDVTVDPLAHLGIITSWHVVGPFDITPEEGLTASFPPETKVNLNDAYPGGPQAEKLRWRSARVDPLDGKLDLVKQGISYDKGAVAYASVIVQPKQAGEAVLYASAVDNITIWINGKKVIERADEYRSNYRTDRYQAKLTLPAEPARILVKLVKTRPEEIPGRGQRGGPPPRWDVQLRLTKPDGTAVEFQTIEENS